MATPVLSTWKNSLLLAAVMVFACSALAQTQPQSVAKDLGGTSWQLVKIQGSDYKEVVPDDKTKYTITFNANGRLNARIDCNRGQGSWKSSGPNQLQFGPLAITRVACPPGSLFDRVVKDWERIQSYAIKNGHLFLSVMANGGTYEYEPMRASKLP